MATDSYFERLEKETRAVKRGHFVLNSGDHSGAFIDFDVVLTQHPEIVFSFSHDLARKLKDSHIAIDTLLGPGSNGAIIAEMVAAHYYLLCGKRLNVAYASDVRNLAKRIGWKTGSNIPQFFLRSECATVVSGYRIGLIDDVLTSGKTFQILEETIADCGGVVKAELAFFLRDDLKAGGIRRLGLSRLHLPRWPAPNCPLCSEGHPVDETVGHGAEFNARKKK